MTWNLPVWLSLPWVHGLLICALTAAAYAAKQRSFADALLCPWVPEFCDKMRHGTDNAFYSALADCASTVIGHGHQLQKEG